MGLSATRALAAGNGLDDFDLFPGTGVLDKMAEVHDAIVAGVRVIPFLSGWVRWVRGRLVLGH